MERSVPQESWLRSRNPNNLPLENKATGKKRTLGWGGKINVFWALSSRFNSIHLPFLFLLLKMIINYQKLWQRHTCFLIFWNMVLIVFFNIGKRSVSQGSQL